MPQSYSGKKYCFCLKRLEISSHQSLCYSTLCSLPCVHLPFDHLPYVHLPSVHLPYANNRSPSRLILGEGEFMAFQIEVPDFVASG